jgi:plastocyanin
VQRSLVILAAGIAAIAVAAPAGAGNNVSIKIEHQVQGCHSWAIGNGVFKASQSLTVARGTAITFTNHDLMPHALKQLAGPAVKMLNIAGPAMGMGPKGPFGMGMMGRVGSMTRITLTKPGTYRFTTKAGEDYISGVVTKGEDNVLKLVVKVK